MYGRSFGDGELDLFLLLQRQSQSLIFPFLGFEVHRFARDKGVRGRLGRPFALAALICLLLLVIVFFLVERFGLLPFLELDLFKIEHLEPGQLGDDVVPVIIVPRHDVVHQTKIDKGRNVLEGIEVGEFSNRVICQN